MIDDVLAAGLDGVVQSAVGDEEEDEGCEDALGHALHKHLLVEEKILVARCV